MSYEVNAGRFFSVPLKRTDDKDLIKPIEMVLSSTCDTTEEGIMKYIRDFDALRKTAVVKPVSKSASAMDSLYEYHDNLVAVGKHISSRNGSDVKNLFTWKDSLQKGGLFSTASKLSVADGEFERLCILYNIAALASQIASEVNLQTDEGLKAATKHFQESAGIFAHIKDRIVSVVGDQQLTADLTPIILKALELTMTAHAQECIYLKASSDPSLSRKQDMLAKVASQASFLYSEAVNAFGEGQGNASLGSVLTMCKAKKEVFECRAQIHQAKVANSSHSYGEAIARYRLVEPTLKNLISCASAFCPEINLQQLHCTVVAEKEAIEKDNNFIYHESIPEVSALPPIGKAQIAKAKVYNADEYFGKNFTDVLSAELNKLNEKGSSKQKDCVVS